MKKNIIEGYEFITHSVGNANFVFSTSVNDLNFNINSEEGKQNLEKLKTWFNLKDIGYLNQIHSNLVYHYDNEVHQGDGLITSRKKVGIGVFTADCVPVLIYDKGIGVIAAVHSGWKGTLSEIVVNTLLKLQEEYGSKMKDLIIAIGPHNMGCCYEIGKDVKDLFLNNEIYNGTDIIEDNKLSLQKCIEIQLLRKGISKENIITVDKCTYCNEEYEFYSYRKQKDSCGRMFSFIFLT